MRRRRSSLLLLQMKKPRSRRGFRFWQLAKLSLGDLARLDAAGAHANPLVPAAYFRLDWTKVHIPAPPANVMRVGDVVAELRAFAAKITFVCHDELQS
jgi:hypothetical protein